MTHTASSKAGRWILLLLGLVFAVPPASPQRYLVHTYTEDDGLPSSTIYDVVQDDAGYMWFATRAGIARYDGVSWTTYGRGEGLARRSQSALALDESGTLWAMSSATAHLATWDGERWRRQAPAPPVTGIGDRDDLWPFAVAIDEGRTYAAVGVRKKGLFVWDGSRWLSPADGLPDSVNDVVAHGGRFTVATPQGLAAYAGARLVSTVRPASGDAWPSPEVLALAFDASASPPRLWLMGRGWVGALVEERFTLLADALPAVAVKERERLVLEPDGLGGVFYGSPAGIYHVDPRHGPRSLGPSSGLAAEGATSFFHDREHNLWIGGLRGLNKIPSLRFETWDQAHGLLENEVTAILELRAGGYVFGHPGGLTFFDPATPASSWQTWRLSSETQDGEAGISRVLDLAEDPAGRLWVATNALGIARIDDPSWAGAGDPRVRWYRDPELLPATSVRVDRGGRVWATGGTEVHRFDGAAFLPTRGEPELSPRRLFAGSAAELYLATGTDGVHVFSGVRWRRLAAAEPDADDVFAVLEDTSGRLWAGTSAGLFQARGDGLERAGLAGREVRRPVYFLSEDTSGRLWMGTDNGVVRWDESAGELRRFTVSEGLAGRETNRAAGLVDSAGRVWIGTDRGLTIYHEEREHEPPPPRLELRELEVAGVTYPLTRSITLGTGHRDLVFRFRALSFLDERRLGFRCRLEGFDETWLEESVSPRQEIRYTNLSPGTYRLFLQARNAAGTWSEVVASPPVEIPRPYPQRWWFRASGILAAAALLLLVQRLLAQRRYARLLETEVRRRTAELEFERAELAVTLDSIADGVIVGTLDGTVSHLNPAAEAMTGWSREEAVGRPLSEVLPLESGEAGEAGVDAVARVRDAGQAVRLGKAVESDAAPGPDRGLVMRDRRGRMRRVEVTGAPLGAAAATKSGVVFAFRDVTAQRELEKEALKAQKLESVGVLAGGIAHEFNNVLTGVLGNLELLHLEGAVRGEAAEFLNEAREEIFHARDVAQRLLTFSRGGAPVCRAVSPATVVAEAVGAVAEAGAVRFDVELPDDLRMAEIDAGQIHQALSHLLRNAQQAMPEGGRVRIRARNLEVDSSGAGSLRPGSYVSLEIEDQGPGIAEDDLTRVFDPYFTTWPGHSGLGLTTAYSIVRNHGGRLTVSSLVPRGTLARVDLPACLQIRPEAPAPEKPERGGGRLLLMDDDKGVRLITGRMLARLGYEHETARHGEEALELFETARRWGEPFDAVILDLEISGGMGGRETLERMRRLDPDVRAVVCSGYSNDPVMAEYRDYGFRAVLPKPFGLDALSRILREVLAARRPAVRERG